MRRRRTTLHGMASLILVAGVAVRMPGNGIEVPGAGLCEGLDLPDIPSDGNT